MKGIQFYNFALRLLSNNLVWYGGGFSLLLYSGNYFIRKDFERNRIAKIRRLEREAGKVDNLSSDRWLEPRQAEDEERSRNE